VAPYLRPTAQIAADALLPADPGLAMAIAQRAMVKPLMANHHHGLWGYSGNTAAGAELTVQASGIGGPSAAAVVGELAGHGVRRLIRVGRCAALDAGLEPGGLVVATRALGDDGVCAALGVAAPRPDAALTDALLDSLDAAGGVVASADLPAPALPAERRLSWLDGRARVLDLETAAVLALAERLGIAAASVLVVAESPAGRADAEALDAALVELGPALTQVLGARAVESSS
jgi:uridine phosphorylase